MLYIDFNLKLLVVHIKYINTNLVHYIICNLKSMIHNDCFMILNKFLQDNFKRIYYLNKNDSHLHKRYNL